MQLSDYLVQEQGGYIANAWDYLENCPNLSALLLSLELLINYSNFIAQRRPFSLLHAPCSSRMLQWARGMRSQQWRKEKPLHNGRAHALHATGTRVSP